jgi:hypothetical protein
MISDVGKNELRHRIKQIPFKAVERAVGDKAFGAWIQDISCFSL